MNRVEFRVTHTLVRLVERSTLEQEEALGQFVSTGQSHSMMSGYRCWNCRLTSCPSLRKKTPVNMGYGTEEGVKDKIKTSPVFNYNKQTACVNERLRAKRCSLPVMSSILADKVNIICLTLFSITPVSSINTSSWNIKGRVNKIVYSYSMI